MESTRQLKVARLLQKDFSDIFQKEGSRFAPGGLISVTRVRVTPDLYIARIYLSLFAVADKDAVMKAVNEHNKEFRRTIGNRIKNQVRLIPELEFFLDDSLDYLDNIDRLLKQ